MTAERIFMYNWIYKYTLKGLWHVIFWPFYHLQYYISIFWVYADGLKNFLLSGYSNIYILNFYPHLAKCFIICSSFTEHTWKSLKRVYLTCLNISNAIFEHAWGQLYYFSFSSVFRKHVWNYLSGSEKVLKRVQ